MKPKQKAEDLVGRFSWFANDEYHELSEQWELDKNKKQNSKGAALILVQELINVFEKMHKPEYASFDCIGGRELDFESEAPFCLNGYEMIEYYKQVKEEIENL